MALAETIRFAGAIDADSSTDYRLDSDETTAGTFATVTTQDATTPYAPVSTTLNGSLTRTATTVVLTDGASFSEGDYVMVDGEMILLGAKSTHTFTGCTRGYGGTVAVAHATSLPVYKAHESFSVTPTWNSGRKLIRYRLVRVEGANTSVASEVTLYNPPSPPDADHITIYGALESEAGAPVSGITVRLSLSVNTAWGQRTGETQYYTLQSTTSGVDGFFSFTARRDALRQDGGAYVLTIDPAGKNQSFTIESVPDQETVNYLELS